jgi:hypothetical protein
MVHGQRVSDLKFKNSNKDTISDTGDTQIKIPLAILAILGEAGKSLPTVYRIKF